MSDLKYKYNKDADYDRQGIFTQSCPNCKKQHKVVTQSDERRPEYYTTVYTYCDCGYELEWNLPVN